MHRTARFFGGILFLAAVLAVPFLIFQNYFKSHPTGSRLERRLADLESRLAQEIAIRQALSVGGESAGFVLPGSPAPATSAAVSSGVSPAAGISFPSASTGPSAFPEVERAWRQEMEKKDRQIDYLRSMVEKLASQPSSMASPAATIPQPPVFQNVAGAGFGGSPQVALEALPIQAQATPAAGPIMNQLVGEVIDTQAGDGTLIVNRGSKHGVKPGTFFEVYRRGHFVGRVQVAAVYEGVSSASVMDQNVEILPGDMVRSSRL